MTTRVRSSISVYRQIVYFLFKISSKHGYVSLSFQARTARTNFVTTETKISGNIHLKVRSFRSKSIVIKELFLKEKEASEKSVLPALDQEVRAPLDARFCAYANRASLN